MMDTDPPDDVVVDVAESEGPNHGARDVHPGSPACPWVSLPQTDTKGGAHRELVQVAVLVAREPVVCHRVPRVLRVTGGHIWNKISFSQ